MQKVGGILAATLLYVLVPAELHAQTEAEAVATSLAICKGDETVGDNDDKSQYLPCEQYIDAHIKHNSDTIGTN